MFFVKGQGGLNLLDLEGLDSGRSRFMEGVQGLMLTGGSGRGNIQVISFEETGWSF